MKFQIELKAIQSSTPIERGDLTSGLCVASFSDDPSRLHLGTFHFNGWFYTLEEGNPEASWKENPTSSQNGPMPTRKVTHWSKYDKFRLFV